MRGLRALGITALFGALVVAGCDQASTRDDDASEEGAPKGEDDGKFDTTNDAVFVDFAFDAHVITDEADPAKARDVIEAQLFYTFGALQDFESSGRLDRLALPEIDHVALGDGAYRIDYHAQLPVVWSKKRDVPQSHPMVFPVDMRKASLEGFLGRTQAGCKRYASDRPRVTTWWYFWRPGKSTCVLEDDDVLRPQATVTVSDVTTSGRYPEYHRVYEDGVVRVVAIFAKNVKNTVAGDAGIDAYDEFVARLQSRLADHDLTTEPAEIPTGPGVKAPDITFHAALPGGAEVEVTALLVDSLRKQGPELDARLAELTPEADLIAYSGHASAGRNLRHIAQTGTWQAGQHVIVFLNACGTIAYTDPTLAETLAALNPDDPSGTQHLDLVANARPAFFHEYADGVMAVVDGLLEQDQPRTYERIFQDIDDSQIVLVTGEQDNRFVPGFEGDEGEPGLADWDGMSEVGELGDGESVTFTTPRLEPGVYRFMLDGSGDGDLYVRTGLPPTLIDWECRPYRIGVEECVITLPVPAEIHAMVVGADASSFVFDAQPASADPE